jgi:hypothetical protein
MVLFTNRAQQKITLNRVRQWRREITKRNKNGKEGRKKDDEKKTSVQNWTVQIYLL